MSTILTISKKKLNCFEIIDLLRKNQINCNIQNNITIINNELENGCEIKFSGHPSKKKICNTWILLKNKFNFKCAHLSNPFFNRCILDYCNKSLCK